MLAKTVATSPKHQLAVLVLNNYGPGDPHGPQNISLTTRKQLGIDCSAGCTVADVWTGTALPGTISATYVTVARAHGHVYTPCHGGRAVPTSR